MSATSSPPRSLRTLLTGVIDYAGLFPPANLTVEDAVASWRRYRADPAAWMLGRFVCPTAKLGALATLGWSANDGAISLIGGRESKTPLADAAAAIASFPNPGLVDAIEFASPETVSAAATLYRETPLDRLDEAIARATREGTSLKFRTGGTTADAFPTNADLARVIHACRDAAIAWKATAGLHHPMPNLDASGGRAHGFLNLLVATVLAHAHRIDATAIEAILDDDRPQNFRFDEDSLTWGDYTASVAEISASRRDSFRSFGSCSFLEPRDDLTALNWFHG